MDAVGRFKKGSALAEKAEKVFLTHMVQQNIDPSDMLDCTLISDSFPLKSIAPTALG